MHYPLTDIQADFEINRLVRYRNTAKRNYFHRRQTDRQTEGQTDGRTDGQMSRTTTIGSFFQKKKKLLKTVVKFYRNSKKLSTTSQLSTPIKIVLFNITMQNRLLSESFRTIEIKDVSCNGKLMKIAF